MAYPAPTIDADLEAVTAALAGVQPRPGRGDSDVDLLVEFGPIDISKKFHTYLEARAAFSKILQSEVDLVMSGAVKNKVIASEIDRTKKLIYGT
ncbi:MAG: hypothetical protein NTW51_07435 [Cyanobacteria bacterium]|nr:hypothetical protein [Cyanobacteriota bacterium]